MLHWEDHEFAIVVRVILVENSDGSAISRDINPAKTWIKFDDIRPARHLEKRDWRVLVQVESRHQFISFTGKKCAVMFWVERHSMISIASAHGITRDDFIRRGVANRENVLVLQVYVYFARNRIVLRHSRFAVEV